MFGNPMEIAIIAGVAVLLFGGGKIRDVARGLGAAKREFSLGQAEADAESERIRTQAQARARAEAVNLETPHIPEASGSGESIPPPVPEGGTTIISGAPTEQIPTERP